MCLYGYFFGVLVFMCASVTFSESWTHDELLCVQQGPCNCTYINGDYVDLSPLSNGHEPLVAASKTYLYMFSPCRDANLKGLVANTSCTDGYGLCYFEPATESQTVLKYNDVISRKVNGTFRRLAMNAEAVLRMNDREGLEVVFKNSEGDNVTTTTFELHCSANVNNYTLLVQMNKYAEHVLSLTSRYACPIKTEHISGASVFFLIMIMLAIVYFVGGVLVLKFLRGATGVEMIPNHEFWCSIPGAIKRGFMFVKSCGRTSAETYDSI